MTDNVEEAMAAGMLPAPQGWVRNTDGRWEIHVGKQCPPDRSSGFSTQWTAVYDAMNVREIVRESTKRALATPAQPKASEGKAGGEDAKDAARYRWLRSQVRWQLPNQRDSWTTPSGVYLVATMVSKVYGDCAEQTDAAIDAAMTATLTAPGADDGQ